MDDYEGCERVVVKTGNVINNNDILKRPGKTAADELWEGLRSAASAGIRQRNGDEMIIKCPEKVYADDVDFNDLLTTVKIFVNDDSQDLLKEAIKKCLSYLETSRLGILVVAFQPGSPQTLESLKTLWSILQASVDDGTVQLIGLSDVDTEMFIELYNWARVKPSIVQISLTGCCLVPPQLKDFTKLHDIQLLTHSDPHEMLPQDKLDEILPGFPVKQLYVAKFQAHIKCRGVLATKGYLLCAHKGN
ncbi:Aldo/keto reductase family [Nesidiocoris tenuis]|uniref:GCS light chain n=1 Tax=Nesidiocoris tenuis TaxID=355587 RepID=A0ABN7B9N5_9HEMI|nr:Aldo/keto reductase family [Nesidiocoris tenuis]